MKTGSGIVAVLLAGLAFPPGTMAGAACDAVAKQRADAHYAAARSAGSQAEMIRQLRAAIERCPTFEAYYALGRTYLRQGDLRQAGEAFKLADGRVAPEAYYRRGLALGRLAETYRRQEKYVEALLAAEQARDWLGDRTPVWLLATLQSIELEEPVVRSDEIKRILTTKKNVGVEPAIHLRINFGFDQFILTAQGRAQTLELGQAMQALSELGDMRFTLIGHTDKTGDAAYNQRLSERRAATVAAELARGHPSLVGRIRTEGRGKSALRYPGNSPKDHALNRRVEIKVHEAGRD